MNQSRNKAIRDLWMVFQDIIGPAKLWPYRIRHLFWTKGVKHFDRCLVAEFVWINVLNPQVFMEWVDLMGLCSDIAARHLINLFELFKTRPYRLYAYNVHENRYEYIDGTVAQYNKK